MNQQIISDCDESESRSEQITIPVTPTMFNYLKSLADISCNGDISELVVKLIRCSKKENFKFIKRLNACKNFYDIVLKKDANYPFSKK